MAEHTTLDDASAKAGPVDDPSSSSDDKGDGPVEEDEAAKEDQNAEHIFQIIVALPHRPYKIPVMVSTQEQVQDLRQSITEVPETFQYSCFHLEHHGVRINDFVELSDVKGLAAGSEIRLVEDAYTEREARLHMIRVRELVGAVGERIDIVSGVSAGISLHDGVVPPEGAVENGRAGRSQSSVAAQPVAEYDFDAPPEIATIMPPQENLAPKTVKSLCVSPWNPPPHQLRHKGHLMYLQLTTQEGEQFQITSHLSGFFVNRSSNTKFDPFPRAAPKNASAHSLLTLISKLSPSFDTSFTALQEFNGRRDPLANFQITNVLPFTPWIVSPSSSMRQAHQPDITRSQEAWLLSGNEISETLRDWNEEFQSTREMPKEQVQERVFRERLISKLFADYTEAAARGAVLVARGEIAPLNPTENKDAQIFVYNNIFFSYGADGMGTFTTEGGDEAARIAVGKDVGGVRLVSQLDINGLFTPGTIIVDYLGKRIVGQSIVPGIFKQREPGEHQIDYGGVEGRDVVTENEAFVETFAKLSKALRSKKHDVWDKEGKTHTLEASVETKGLLGTDGRKYVLDLYRLTPLDVVWIEENWSESQEGKPKTRERNYPHRMSILRHELVEAYWRARMTEYVGKQIDGRKKGTGGIASGQANASKETNGDGPEEAGDEVTKDGEDSASDELPERVDISEFELAFNADVYSGQVPPTEAEVERMAGDEKDVRSLCGYLRDKALPELVKDLQEGDVGFPMDGQSLSRLMHKRGINIRYLGALAGRARSQPSRLDALAVLATQEMVSRAFKHVANRFLKAIPAIFAIPCLVHLLNCLLGSGVNKSPEAQVDNDMLSVYPDTNLSFTKVTPEDVRAQIEEQTFLRYRYDLGPDWIGKIKHLQLLREIALKLGLQLAGKQYRFKADPVPLTNGSPSLPNGNHPTTNGIGGKKKKKNVDPDAAGHTAEPSSSSTPVTFEVDDILNIVPIVKDSCPRSALAEEAMEAGRISIAQNQKELGQELLLEGLSLHEQIYGILHPEVARIYHTLSMIYYQLDEKSIAVELARKAVIVSERTLGVDSNETILSYLNLGLFEHADGNSKAALIYVRHALELWKIVFGLNHPDSITTINNAAVMLQNLKQYHASRLWFEKSLEVCELVSGKTSVNTATLCFQLAQALALDQDAKAAVNRMREAYSIFLAQLGPDDRNTKESESWLEQLTQNAVSIAKHAKDVQARKLRRIQLTPRVTLGTRPTPQVGQKNDEVAIGSEASNPLNMDSRSVDELIRFIEGGADGAKRTPKKKPAQRDNPKRRAGSNMAGRAAA